MGHVPHLLLPPPWPDAVIPLGEAHRRHLRVLRRSDGDAVSYTDGHGRAGRGRIEGDGIVRGEEVDVPPPACRLSLAVAPPDSRDRQRFLVEKLAELGVTSILWLDTRHGEGRPPPASKAQGWADAALEQSRGAWRTSVEERPCRLSDVPLPVWVADAGGPPAPDFPARLTIAVGPEGGWAPEEIDGASIRFGLGDRVLRVETAAVAAASLAMIPTTLRARTPRSVVD